MSRPLPLTHRGEGAAGPRTAMTDNDMEAMTAESATKRPEPPKEPAKSVPAPTPQKERSMNTTNGDEYMASHPKVTAREGLKPGCTVAVREGTSRSRAKVKAITGAFVTLEAEPGKAERQVHRGTVQVLQSR